MPEHLDIQQLLDQGLNSEDAKRLQEQFGKNRFKEAGPGRLGNILLGLVKEPMFIILMVACCLYFILGELTEGFMMFTAIIIVTAISIYQEVKSTRALAALEKYTAPLSTLVRDRKQLQVASEDIVPGDLLLLSEGDQVPADGNIIIANDLSVNESVITGESMPVEKSRGANGQLFQGSTINSGSCAVKVTAIGNSTSLGKLGKLVNETKSSPTLLQKQTQRVVTVLASFGVVGFLVIFFINFSRNGDLVNSLLLGLTLAMAAIPEEIPVAFSSFMALGAYTMSQMGIVPKQPQIVEHIGATSVLCLDKTGTITENKMQVASVYHFDQDQLIDIQAGQKYPADNVIKIATLASERFPFDTMEQAIWKAYGDDEASRNTIPAMIHEYPLGGKPPMMTHVYPWQNEILAAGKGAVERILRICKLPAAQQHKIQEIANREGAKGYRVLGVAKAMLSHGVYPESQDDFAWEFTGLICLFDPPRKDAPITIEAMNDAGINVKLITGDFEATAKFIAQSIGLETGDSIISGDKVLDADETELRSMVRESNLFVRMFPEAKLKVINALKANGEIVAMTGDGVNDGPALKAAHIGIAMGKKGTEIAKLAANLVITNDQLSMIPAAVSHGRQIYQNIKKAIRYIIAIHIPIILMATLPLVLGWKYPNIFSPIHIIFLELIMGPTCSLFFQKEPVEGDIMKRPPRKIKKNLFSAEELTVALVQGIAITIGLAILYLQHLDSSIILPRSMVFMTFLFTNIFLTFACRSFTATFFTTIRYKNSLSGIVLLASILFIILVGFVAPIRSFFGMQLLTIPQLFQCFWVALVSVGWYEVYKFARKVTRQDKPVIKEIKINQ